MPTTPAISVTGSLVLFNKSHARLMRIRRIMFNVPYWIAKEKLWEDHPMMNESDLLCGESSKEEVLEWLLNVRKPGQGVMTTIIGGLEEGECDPGSWMKWYERGCDFLGYTWGVPPDFRPHTCYDTDLKTIWNAFQTIDDCEAT